MIDFTFVGEIPIDGQIKLTFVNKFGEEFIWSMPEEELELFNQELIRWANKYIEWRIAPCTCDGMPKHDDMPLTEED